MNHHLFTLLFLLIPFLMTAQQTSGMVTYEEIVKMEIDLPEGSEQYAHLLPTEQKSDFVLRFTPQEAHYVMKKEAAQPAPVNMEEGGAQIQIKVLNSSENAAIYTNLDAQQRTELRDLFGRPFRIETELGDANWKMTTDQKEILGFTCIKAISGPDSLQTIAWFTPQIAIPTGPANFGELPGLILEVSQGSRTIIAKEVLAEIDDPTLIEAPSKGKKITEEEYDALMEEKMEEMQQSMPRGGTTIRIRG